MKKSILTLVIAGVVALAALKAIPLLASTYSYMTWQQNNAQVILKDGTEIAGSIKFHSFRCDNYEIKNKNGIHVVPKNSVRELKIQLEAVNIR